MILTGRIIDSEDAQRMGIANRVCNDGEGIRVKLHQLSSITSSHSFPAIFLVVPLNYEISFTALSMAVAMAKQISKYPQKCLKADRESTFHSVYNSESKKVRHTGRRYEC